MNDKQATEAAFLLYQRVKVTIAVMFVKLIPENTNIEEFVKNFQYKFKKKASHCNLYLEKQIFQNQFILLLPEIKIYSVTRPFEKTYEPMDTDNYEATLVAKNNNSFHFVSIPTSSRTLSERQIFLLQKIELIINFVDAVLTTNNCCNENKDFTLADINGILSKLEIRNILGRRLTKGSSRNLVVSSNLVQYLFKSVDVYRIISEGLLKTISLLEEYSENTNEEFSIQELQTMQFANNVVLKCVTTFQQNPKCDQAITLFLRKSLENLFTHRIQVINRNMCDCWYGVFGTWRKVEFTCLEMIDALITILRNIISNIYPKVVSMRFTVVEYVLIILKRLLVSYCKLYRNTSGHVYIDQWERTLSTVIADSISQHQVIVRLAWHCLKIVISLKLSVDKKVRT